MLPCPDEEDVPERLLDLCFTFIVRNLDSICYICPITECYTLYPGLLFPTELCEKFFKFYHSKVGKLDDKFIKIFDSKVTSIKRLCLRNSSISDDGLETILKHKLVELELENCKNITEKSLTVLNQYGENLLDLTVGNGVKLLPVRNVASDKTQCYVVKTPKLKRLAIRNLREQMYFDMLFLPLPNLTHLDLSGCMDIEDFSFLVLLSNLEHLVLHNVSKVQEGLECIYKLKNLRDVDDAVYELNGKELRGERHLDISQSNEKLRKFDNENETLAEIVRNLPSLISLDISGTNLAGTGVAEKDQCGISDIPGLNSRIDKPLWFLGLYRTQNGACRRHDIPAFMISGDANENQILLAAAAYIDRPEVLQKVLNDLYHLFRYEQCENILKALNFVLAAMQRHLPEKHIQISGSATLFYIVKNKDIPPMPPKIRRRVISTLLNGMCRHKNDDTMMRNGCLTLCQFSIPQDVLFEYQRLVLTLLHIVSHMDQVGFVQRIGIYLLNSLACQVDNCQKKLLGDLGAIERMLRLIEYRVEHEICDDVLEVAWSTMWNVTDETAVNCERFLNGKGMDYFVECLKRFSHKDELMRNMMGLLGNVAEVKHLRQRLMVTDYINVFNKLMFSCSDGIEVSYNAAGVLSNLASDGPDAWGKNCPDRRAVLRNMVNAIEQWNIGTERNINYRSFMPILRVINKRHTPECQHWGTWALANLTRVYPEKYCSLVEEEGGIEILQNLLLDDIPYARVKELANMVLVHCKQFRENGRVDIEPQLDG